MSPRTYPDARCSEILDFYFGAAAQSDCDLEAFRLKTRFWFMRNAAVDAEIRGRFARDVDQAASGELDQWGEVPLGRLALVVLLDQFPRNMNRGSPLAFATDEKALAVALRGVAAGDPDELTDGERLVFYLPIMHAEDEGLQDRSVSLFKKLAGEAGLLRPELEMALVAAERHREIVMRFRRFPHRNSALGRVSTADEVAFLAEPNSSF